jgi:hypothetical protein
MLLFSAAFLPVNSRARSFNEKKYDVIYFGKNVRSGTRYRHNGEIMANCFFWDKKIEFRYYCCNGDAKLFFNNVSGKSEIPQFTEREIDGGL